MAKPSIPQGTRDFSAEVVHKRNYILNTIRQVFQLYGFEPLETPAMENLETLTGKYGEEGDKLIFKILNNGLNDPKNTEKAKAAFDKLMAGTSSTDLTERALKYDLTIPFARYVAMNSGKLTMPFKRYQVQQVWRADRPQRGRYREFTQCDADVVGSTSLLNEIELCNIYHQVFTELKLDEYELKINSRKLLSGLADLCGGKETMTDITIAIDKLDKIGIEKVNQELETKGIQNEKIEIINQYLSISGSNEEKLIALAKLFSENETALSGIKELQFVCDQAPGVNLTIDPTLARGLNYYTGIIFEVTAPAKVKMGSIGGGGRYDDLTGLFGVPNIPGIGISFGVDRIYDVLDEMQLFPKNIANTTKLLFFNMGADESLYALKILQQLRKESIACEIFHEPAKLDKQFKYAEKKHIPFIAIIGTKEMANGEVQIKNLSTGTQEGIPLIKLSDWLKTK